MNEPLGKRIGKALDILIPYGMQEDGRLLRMADFLNKTGPQLSDFPDEEKLVAFRKSQGYWLSKRGKIITLSAPDAQKLHKAIAEMFPKGWETVTSKRNTIFMRPILGHAEFFEQLAGTLKIRK